MSDWEDSSRGRLDSPENNSALTEFMREGRAARIGNSRKFAEVTERLQKIETRQQEMDDGQLHIIKLLERNTEITEEIRDLRTTGKVITKVVIWFGGIAAAVTAFVGLYFATWGKK